MLTIPQVDFNLQAIRPDPIPILSSPTPNPHLTASDIQDLLHAEQTKRQRWAFENAVRGHNHLGLAVGLLQALAKASVGGTDASEGGGGGLWEKTIEGAKEAMKTRIAKRREMMALAGKGGKLPERMDLDD
jgi:ubiquitin carboxyl-terminal hydrolase L5